MPLDQGTAGDLLTYAKDNLSSPFDVTIQHLFVTPLNSALNMPLVNTIFSTMTTIGMAMMLLFYLIDLQQQVVKKNFTIDHFVRGLAKFIIGYAVMANAAFIVRSLNQFSIAIINIVGASTITNPFSEVIAQWSARLSNADIPKTFFEITYLSLGIALAACIQILFMLVIAVVAIKRALELTVYYILSPLMMADVFSNGISGMMPRLKRMFALYMQYPFICIGLTMAMQLLNSPAALGGTLISGSALYISVIVLWTVVKFVARSKSEVERMFS